MGGVSAAWLWAVQSAEHGTWLPEREPSTSLLPWIAPRVPAQLATLIQRADSERKLEPGDCIVASHERVDRLVFVRSGLTARAEVDPASNKPEAIAISPRPPGRGQSEFLFAPTLRRPLFRAVSQRDRGLSAVLDAIAR